MPGFNVRSLTSTHVAELLVDPGHKVMLDSFVGEQIIGADNVEPVTRLSGSTDKAPLSMSTANADPTRRSIVNPGDPTPKINTKADKLDYECVSHRLAAGLPAEIYDDADTAIRKMEELMRLQVGAMVKMDTEATLLDILKGTSGSTPISLTGKEWNAYSDPDHNPIRDIIAAIEATGGASMFLGRNVATALAQSPKLTGSSAGSGTEFLSDEQLIAKLQALGLASVMIAKYDHTNSRALNLPPLLARFYNNIACVYAPGAIKKFVKRAFTYDAYDDEDTEEHLFRAKETSVFVSAYPESIHAFTGVLV